jgi:hypothetical protein
VSLTYVPAEVRKQVHDCSEGRCEYCLLSEEDAFFPHEPDHIIAEKHGGTTTIENLAFACFACNRFNGSDIASIDPVTGELVPLFNPRKEQWSDHFGLDDGAIIGVTAVGRATERLLKLNVVQRLEARKTLAQSGRYP